MDVEIVKGRNFADQYKIILNNNPVKLSVISMSLCCLNYGGNIVFAIFKKRAKMIFCHKAFTFVAFKKRLLIKWISKDL